MLRSLSIWLWQYKQAYGEAYGDHNNNLRRLVEKARKIELRINLAKMPLQREEVCYIDGLISGDVLKPDPGKVAANHEDVKANRYKVNAAVCWVFKLRSKVPR